MLKKFFDGLAFGAGFALSFIALWYLASFWFVPAIVENRMEGAMNHSDVTGAEGSQRYPSTKTSGNEETQFHELAIDEQIKRASVIALTKYERVPSGEIKAVITEFLKKDPNVELYYDIGDEYPDAVRNPRQDADYGEGSVMFFVGSPAEFRLSISYHGDRIRGLGDMPLKLMREKCNPPDA